MTISNWNVDKKNDEAWSLVIGQSDYTLHDWFFDSTTLEILKINFTCLAGQQSFQIVFWLSILQCSLHPCLFRIKVSVPNTSVSWPSPMLWTMTSVPMTIPVCPVPWEVPPSGTCNTPAGLCIRIPSAVLVCIDECSPAACCAAAWLTICSASSAVISGIVTEEDKTKLYLTCHTHS